MVWVSQLFDDREHTVSQFNTRLLCFRRAMTTTSFGHSCWLKPCQRPKMSQKPKSVIMSCVVCRRKFEGALHLRMQAFQDDLSMPLLPGDQFFFKRVIGPLTRISNKTEKTDINESRPCISALTGWTPYQLWCRPVFEDGASRAFRVALIAWLTFLIDSRVLLKTGFLS